MRQLLLILACALVMESAASQANWELVQKPITGSYGIYGGGLSDPVAPSRNDSKIMFSIAGKSARDMFDALGPDVKDICTEGMGMRVRKKDNENLTCLRTEKGEYSCSFGFDLRTGKSIGGSVC
jgi:hypothetical protein